MKSKSAGRRGVPPPARSNRGILVGVVLVLAGAAAALTIERMPSGAALPAPTSSHPAATSAIRPTATPADRATAEPPSPSASPSPSPASAVLEAEMPAQIAGVPLTVTSATGASVLGTTPAARALSAASAKLGASADALELAYGYDASGSITGNILAFRIPGVAAAVLEPVILNDWLSVGAPGVSVLSDTLSGVSAWHVSYGDKGPDEWVISHGDAVFIVETTDRAIASSTIAALHPAQAMSSGSPAPSAATTSSSPQVSPSP